MSEFQLIYRYLAQFGAGPWVQLSVGDDAAVVAPPPGHVTLVSTDTQIEGRHFPTHTLPEHIAYRAVAAAASDLAAMAAHPMGMTLALTLPSADELWLHSFSLGLGRVVKDLSLPLVGGDLTRGPLALTITVLGHAPADSWCRRSGATSGDLVAVTGTLGDSAAGLCVLEGDILVPDGVSEASLEWLEQRFFAPSPRFEFVDWLAQYAHASIDISDGLLADLGHVAHASGISIDIESQRLPLSQAIRHWPESQALKWALTGGDDYELAFTFPSHLSPPPGSSVIGRVLGDGSGVRVDGECLDARGYDHFQ